ncbi:MAG: hypothetical protein CSA09_03175 [Candidatus Contendobacter odensis]|uniref:Uncharacterized protein n=1 Tax=Candidatus Contendibacter odensensis TaxID=1400860 RepID=A0A2G6PEV0_9GAMM|nr:MAG: hypothetical protein CSA09_03175 [Candidatus Contendobacter odensis]
MLFNRRWPDGFDREGFCIVVIAVRVVFLAVLRSIFRVVVAVVVGRFLILGATDLFRVFVTGPGGSDFEHGCNAVAAVVLGADISVFAIGMAFSGEIRAGCWASA